MRHNHKEGGCGCGCGGHGEVLPALEPGLDWAAMPDEEVVCGCAGVRKAAVVAAVRAGANTLPLIKVMTGAGRGKDCASLNPRGRCCHADLRALIAIYGGPPSGGSCCA